MQTEDRIPKSERNSKAETRSSAPAPQSGLTQVQFSEPELSRMFVNWLLSFRQFMEEHRSRRNEIASLALNGLLANPQVRLAVQPGENTENAYARQAVCYADALLAELALPHGKEPRP